MNTTAKGDTFELRTLELIRLWFEKKEFIIPKEGAELFHKKGYYSHRRAGEIVFDIVIEQRRKPELDPHNYVFIECKDYSKAVPVDDVEEFYDKIGQVKGKNVKGMIFSTSSFAKGALNVAKNSGIALVRVFEDDSTRWFVERASPYLKTSVANAIGSNVLNALLNENFISTRQSAFALNGGVPVVGLEALLSNVLLGENAQVRDNE